MIPIPEDVRSYAACYKQEFGTQITDEEAWHQLAALIDLILVVYNLD
jgi:hypothetical protein